MHQTTRNSLWRKWIVSSTILVTYPPTHLLMSIHRYPLGKPYCSTSVRVCLTSSPGIGATHSSLMSLLTRVTRGEVPTHSSTQYLKFCPSKSANALFFVFESLVGRSSQPLCRFVNKHSQIGDWHFCNKRSHCADHIGLVVCQLASRRSVIRRQ